MHKADAKEQWGYFYSCILEHLQAVIMRNIPAGANILQAGVVHQREDAPGCSQRSHDCHRNDNADSKGQRDHAHNQSSCVSPRHGGNAHELQPSHPFGNHSETISQRKSPEYQSIKQFKDILISKFPGVLSDDLNPELRKMEKPMHITFLPGAMPKKVLSARRVPLRYKK